MQRSLFRCVATAALSVLGLTLILVLGTSSRAETPKSSETGPPEDPPRQLGPSELALPPLEETAKCKDNNKLYVGCDKIFKKACSKQGGQFVCDVPDCSEGSCFLPEED